jgi:glycosyltransferase involved in cell wall biosynthesis
MKILLVNKFYYRRAGAEAYLLDLEALLTAAGHEVAIFATNHPETLESAWSGYFIDAPSFRTRAGIVADARTVAHMIWSRRAAKSFRRLLNDFEPDIIHLHNIYHHLSPSILPVARRAGIPVVQTIHDYKWVCPNYTLWTQHEQCERCHVYRYWNAVRYRCVQGSRSASFAAALEMSIHRALQVYERDVARFITPSAFVRDLLIRWGKAGAKITHLPNAVDLSRLPPSSLHPGNGVVFVGRMEEWKGVRIVLDAAESAPDIAFRFVGGGPLEASIRQRAAELGLSNVAFLGVQPRERVYQEMQRARVVVVPSLGNDPFPTTALEAGALGKPVVGSRVGGIPEIVRDRETGIIVPPGDVAALLDAIRSLEDDVALALRYGAAAERFVRDLVDPAIHRARLLALYEEVIAEPRR